MPDLSHTLNRDSDTVPLLQKGILIKRYKRFLVDVLVDGKLTTSHCPNSGSMLGLTDPGRVVWMSHAHNPKRRLATTLEMVEVDGALVGVNTHRTNLIVQEALQYSRIPELDGYISLKKEVPWKANNARIDFLLESKTGELTYVEVKSVTLKRGDGALFPDAVTLRGTKHLQSLMSIKSHGHRSVMLFVVQREDCAHFSIASHIDPVYGATLKKAQALGVKVLVYQCRVMVSNIWIHKSMIFDDMGNL